MAIIVKNKALRKRIFSKIRHYENLAIKAYKKGKMQEGKKYESKADKLYADNYDKWILVRG